MRCGCLVSVVALVLRICLFLLKSVRLGCLVVAYLLLIMRGWGYLVVAYLLLRMCGWAYRPQMRELYSKMS